MFGTIRKDHKPRKKHPSGQESEGNDAVRAKPRRETPGSSPIGFFLPLRPTGRGGLLASRLCRLTRRQL